MKAKQHKIHCVASCMDCEAKWEDHKTARESARKHAEQTGHTVSGEVAYYFVYQKPLKRV